MVGCFFVCLFVREFRQEGRGWGGGGGFREKERGDAREMGRRGAVRVWKEEGHFTG